MLVSLLGWDFLSTKFTLQLRHLRCLYENDTNAIYHLKNLFCQFIAYFPQIQLTILKVCKLDTLLFLLYSAVMCEVIVLWYLNSLIQWWYTRLYPKPYPIFFGSTRIKQSRVIWFSSKKIEYGQFLLYFALHLNFFSRENLIFPIHHLTLNIYHNWQNR